MLTSEVEDQHTDELVRAIETRAAKMASVVLERVYEDPFWDARFGKRGRYHTERDGKYHLDYLVQALSANAPSVMVDYARWLRSVLVTRGMCSLHLAENFALFRAVLGENGLPGVERAEVILAAAERALLYEVGTPAAIDRAAPIIARELGRSGDPVATERDLRRHLSFLADSIDLGRPDLFGGYVKFMSEWCGDRERVKNTISSVVEALTHTLVPAARDEIESHVSRAV
ncbi:MAG: hypothetical protein HOV80_22880 [Polyangiaceae bacterium]|nr:hypothetical protein [Polyangiaceae bacterium]